MSMLRYNETMRMIFSLERSIKDSEKKESLDQRDYAQHCKRMLAAYIVEHRKAARREGEYAIR